VTRLTSQRSERFARTAGCLVFLTGTLVLLGWALDLAVLKNVFPRFSPMSPNGALAFMLAGAALWWLTVGPVTSWKKQAAQAAAVAVALIGVLTFGEYIFGWKMSLSQFFPRPKINAAATPLATRPSLLTAVNFIWIGLALLLLDSKPRVRRWSVELFVVVPIVISLLALIGYACDVPSFYEWRSLFPNTAMALHTAIAFVVLGMGLLFARPDRGLMKVLTGKTAGGLVARRLLLAPVVIPLVTGLVGMICRRIGFFNPEFWGWIFSFLNIFVFTAVIWWIATLLHEEGTVRLRAEEEVRQLNATLEQRVTERTAELQQARELLQQEKERLRLIIETALDGVITIDGQGIVTGWSPQAETIFGWPAAEMLGRQLSETIIPPAYRDAHEQGLKQFSKTRGGAVLNRRLELRALRRDGKEIPVELAITPVQLGDEYMFSAFVRDITERKAAEEALADERNLLRLLIANLPACVYVKDPEGRFLVFNKASARLVGLDSEAVALGKTVYDFFPPDIARLYEADDRRVLTEGAAILEREEPTQDGEGHARCFLTTKIPLRDSHHAVVGLLGISQDITARKESEKVIERHRAELQLIFDTVPAIIFYKDRQHRLLRINEASARCLGISKSEIEGRTDQELGSPHADRYCQDEKEVMDTGQPKFGIVEPVETARGTRWLQTDKFPYRDEEGRIAGIIGFALDVTERRQAEQRIRDQLSRLDLLQRITRAIGERQDLQSIFQVVIRTLENDLPIDFGCVCLYEAQDEVLTVTSVGVRSAALAMELALAEQSRVPIDQNGLGRCVRGQLVYEPDISQSGFPFPQRLAGGGLRSFIAAPLLVESQVFGVLVVARRNPNSFNSSDCEFLKQLSEHVALAAHQAQLYGALQQAYNDLRQTQQAVMQQERLRVLGQMASGIAHDINNAISPVVLYSESLLEKEPNLSPRARRYLETIQHSAGDVTATVARMREFYRQREPQLTLAGLDLNALAEQVAELTRARWSDMPLQRGIVISLLNDLAPDLPTVRGVESEIREALTNLVFNAVDAMPNGGTLTLRTRVTEARNSHIGPAPRQVHLEVADTGIGMDEETRRRCLEPFFTTKGERGTGLGLAMVYGVAQRHSAGIEIESAPGRGTTVRLSFSVHADILEDEPGTLIDNFSIPSRMRILAVDDDPLVTKSLHDTLEADGHVVVTANHGQEGIDAFHAAQARQEPFAVVITDLGMPYLDGRQVAIAIKKAAPDTPVILLTGWGQRLLAEGDIPPHVDFVLSKPPRLLQLRETLARCVNWPALKKP
jgi:PAS domain S-box-containing protein